MIFCSHRGPYRFDLQADGTIRAARGAGGVVTAMGPLLEQNHDHEVTWIAAAMSDDDRAASRAGATDGLDIGLELLDLDPDLHRMHYDVVANSVIWFLFHGMFDRVRRPVFDARFREAWDAFVAINECFTAAIAQRAREREIVLVQDYQLMLVPGQLRARRPDLRVVHFTHVPFCGRDDITMLPDHVAAELCGSLASGAAGFHTKRWAASYRDAARTVLGRTHAITPPFVGSLGPDVAALDAVADSDDAIAAGAHLDELVGDRLVVLRSDRVEPSKNIVRGFHAFDRLLDLRPALRERVVFVAMVYPSRQGLAEYLAYTNEVEQVVARINERWSTRDWTPVVLDDRDDYARSIAGLCRYDVLLVNPIRDGLNLVAKEGPVCNRHDGVVCLSTEAGAFEEMRNVVTRVHPYDIEQTALALDTALTMPAKERATLAKRVRRAAVARTPGDWLSDLVREAGE
jgi:trehalose 6-phosphate synthase